MNICRCLVLVSIWLFLVSAGALADVLESLRQDIKNAQTKLNKTEQKIFSEKKALAHSLESIEKEVLELRKQSAVLLRAKDESALAIEELENRLSTWEAQSQYQLNLITRFLIQENPTLSEKPDKQTQPLEQLNAALNLADAGQGQFYSGRLIQSDGSETQASLLKLGPLIYFSTDAAAGLAVEEKQNIIAALEFNGAQSAALQTLKASGSAEIPVDVSQGRATTRLVEQESVAEHISKGGIWALPILMFALFAISIAGFKLLQVLRLPRLASNLAMRVEHLWAENKSSEQLQLNCWQGELLSVCERLPLGQKRDDALFNSLSQQKQRLENFLGAIALTASVSPLLGLLGTVSGMIETFKLMTLFGAGDPAAVSGGISQALVTTELGLIVAIPALLLHAFLSRKIKQYYQELEQCAIDLSQVNHVAEPHRCSEAMA